MLRSARPERISLTEAAQDELRQAITGGPSRPGSQLPTEAELCEMLVLSRTMVRETLRVPEEEGLLLQRQGVRTLVRNQPVLKTINFNFELVTCRHGSIRPASSTSENPR